MKNTTTTNHLFPTTPIHINNNINNWFDEYNLNSNKSEHYISYDDEDDMKIYKSESPISDITNNNNTTNKKYLKKCLNVRTNNNLIMKNVEDVVNFLKTPTIETSLPEQARAHFLDMHKYIENTTTNTTTTTTNINTTNINTTNINTTTTNTNTNFLNNNTIKNKIKKNDISQDNTKKNQNITKISTIEYKPQIGDKIIKKKW